MKTLRDKVHSNLDDALRNDYDVRGWLIDDIVADLLAFAEDCEDEKAETLKPHVQTWMEFNPCPRL